MTIALAAVGAALATLLLTLLVLWVRQRGRNREAELTDAVRELESRMDAMVRELTDTIERTQHEGQRTRMLGELAGSIDLDEVLNRVLEAAGAIDGVDAALITVAAAAGRRADHRGARPFCDGGRTPGGARPARRTGGPRDLDVVRVRARGRGRRRRGDPLRCRRPAARRDGPARAAHGLHARARHEVRRGAGLGARGARTARRAGDRECAALPRGAPTRRPRRADRPAQSPLLPRDARPRGRARTPLHPEPRPDHLRPRRLQGDQRPHRAPLRGRRARGGGGADPRGRPFGGHRVPRRRRRVRGHPPGVAAQGRGPALRAAADRAVVEARRPGRPA